MWLHLFLFLFTTASIGYLLTRSNLFKPVREWATQKNQRTNYIDVEQSNWIRNPFYWWLDNFFGCWYCNGFYSAIATYVLLHFEIYFICYFFTGALFALISTSLIIKIKDF